MTPRRDKAETRELLLETGYQMLLERGLDVGWGVRLAEVTERVGLTTGAAYQIWSGSRTKSGAGGQDRFHRDLALYAMGRLVSETSVNNAGRLESLTERGHSLDELIRIVGSSDIAELLAPEAGYAISLGLFASAARDPELAGVARNGYQALSDRYAVLADKLLAVSGREVVPPYSVGDLAALMVALGEGLTIRSLVDPDALAPALDPPHDAAPDATGPWHLYAVGLRAIVTSMTRTVPSQG